MRKTIIGLTGFALAALSAPAMAQDAEGDLRCAAVAYFMYASDEKPSDEAFNAVMYFLGRAQAHAGADFRKRLVEAAVRLTPSSAASEINRCAALYVKGANDLEAATPDIVKALTQPAG